MKFTVEYTFETPSQEDAERRIQAMAEAGDAQLEVESVSGEFGRVILVPQDQFAREDTDVKTLAISKQDAEVCEKAMTVVLSWWDVASELGFLPAEGESEQLKAFPFQRLTLIAERYQET